MPENPECTERRERARVTHPHMASQFTFSMLRYAILISPSSLPLFVQIDRIVLVAHYRPHYTQTSSVPIGTYSRPLSACESEA